MQIGAWPAAPSSLRSLLEMQILCSSPDLLSQNLHINEILGDSYEQN